MVMLNTIMAESLDYMRHRAGDGGRRPATDFDTAVQKLLTEIITEHGAVVFNGDGYSENWQIEAAERGLPNLKTTLDALPELITDEADRAVREVQGLQRAGDAQPLRDRPGAVRADRSASRPS